MAADRTVWDTVGDRADCEQDGCCKSWNMTPGPSPETGLLSSLGLPQGQSTAQASGCDTGPALGGPSHYCLCGESPPTRRLTASPLPGSLSGDPHLQASLGASSRSLHLCVHPGLLCLSITPGWSLRVETWSGLDPRHGLQQALGSRKFRKCLQTNVHTKACALLLFSGLHL